MVPGKKKAAIVFATEYDTATCFVAEAARKVKEILLKRYTVLEFFSSEATLAHLYEKIAEHTQFVHQGYTPLQFVLGYFCAHGSDSGLYESEDGIIIDEQLFQYLRGAILIMCSCLRSGELPQRINFKFPKETPVIGYKRYLVVGSQDDMREMDKENYEEFRCKCIEALIQPVCSLLEHNCTVEKACEYTRQKWKQASTIPSLRHELQNLALANFARIHCWGDSSATLIDC